MTWQQSRREFAQQLDILFPNPLFNVTRQNLNKHIKGKRFLRSLDELKDILDTGSEAILKKIVDLTVHCLRSRNINDYKSLVDAVAELKEGLKEEKDRNKLIVGAHLFTNLIYSGAALGSTIVGLLVVQNAVATIATAASIAALGAGPWGILALGVGLTLVAAVIASVEMVKAYQNSRFLLDKQVTEIEDFVDALKPGPKIVSAVAPQHAQAHLLPDQLQNEQASATPFQ